MCICQQLFFREKPKIKKIACFLRLLCFFLSEDSTLIMSRNDKKLIITQSITILKYE